MFWILFISFFPLCFALCPWTFPWKAFKGAHWVLREWQAAKDSRPGGLDSISWELDTLTLRLAHWPLLLLRWTLNETVRVHVCVNLSAYVLEQVNLASRHWWCRMFFALSGHYLNLQWPQYQCGTMMHLFGWINYYYSQYMFFSVSCQ